MITPGFHSKTVQWLRDERRLSTQVVPHELIADPLDATRVSGSFPRPSRAATYGFAGMWAFTAGLVLSMLGMPGIAATTRHMANQVGHVAVLGGVGLLVLAYVTLQVHRDRALVEICPATAEAPSEASVRALHREANGSIVWLVSERVPAPNVLQLASAMGVRCFAPDSGGLRELPRLSPEANGAHRSSRNSSTTG